MSRDIYLVLLVFEDFGIGCFLSYGGEGKVEDIDFIEYLD